MKNIFNSIEEIIYDLKQGKMVIIVDDEDRENEGDLVILADKINAAVINFMIKHGSGIICLALTEEYCRNLDLDLMVPFNNKSKYGTRFTVSIEAAIGVTTGVSAADRTTTILSCIAKNAKPSDLVKPGHVFPLIATEGGVLKRKGHTEASVDLAKFCKCMPAAAVLVEILNPDGSMARRDDLVKFAAVHNLKIGTIENLIEYRLNNEF